MATYTVRMKHREIIAEGTMAFAFEKPADFRFLPGQHVELTLINPPETDGEGNARVFSLASAPHEPELVIATRMRDTAFKRVLRSMPLGAELEMQGPYGSFTLHADDAKPAVFLAGGIGITPFMSIVRTAIHSRIPHRLFLFYANRRPEDAAYLDELERHARENPNFNLIATMTNMGASAKRWNGRTGYLTGDVIRAYLPDPAAAIYYLAGPPAMVGAMREMISALGVGGDNIRTEEFSGYETPK